MFVLRQLSVPIPRGYGSGFMTPFMVLDLGITMFLISYASDMLSLFLSSISRTTTGAMTLMPFILIFQLVFSGGVIPLPEWSRPISNYTISNYGIRAMASQSGYNELPMTTVWTTLSGMRNTEVSGSISVGDILDAMDSPAVDKHRQDVVVKSFTAGDLLQFLSDPSLGLRDKKILFTNFGEIFEVLEKTPEFTGAKINPPLTVGQITDFLKSNRFLQAHRDTTLSMKTSVGDLIDLIGEEKVKDFVQNKTAQAAHKPEYELTTRNILNNWLILGLFILIFAVLATIVLELIDKDKR